MMCSDVAEAPDLDNFHSLNSLRLRVVTVLCFFVI